MAAEGNNDVFGSATLFEDFFNSPESRPSKPEVNDEEQANDDNNCDETSSGEMKRRIDELQQENESLRTQLRLLIHPGGLETSSSIQNSPIAQVLYFNHEAVCLHRHKIEEFFENLSIFMQQRIGEVDEPRPDPQSSSRPLLSDLPPSFSVTGNVQYYLSFCLDSLGRPLLDGIPPTIQDDCGIPHYPVIFHEALPVDETDRPASKSAKRPRMTCWNCGEEHSLRDCPYPRDMIKISAAKKEFQEQNVGKQSLNQRYHKDSDGGSSMNERFAKFKPGRISDELREAMGLTRNQIPVYIYQMRLLGYPPGYLKQAEVIKSGLTVYNIKKDSTVHSEDNEPGEIEDRPTPSQVTFDSTKLIEYPGFNVQLPDGVVQPQGVPPMQLAHSKDVFMKFMTPPRDERRPNKKRKDFEDLPSSKRSRTQPETIDMDIEGDSSAPSSDFKPPLPPTPVYETPPPLPLSTPPATPMRTAPLSERADSPSRLTDSESQTSSRATSGSVSPSMDDLQTMQSRLKEALMQASEDGDSWVPSSGEDSDRFLIDGEEYIVDSVTDEEMAEEGQADDGTSQKDEDVKKELEMEEETVGIVKDSSLDEDVKELEMEEENVGIVKDSSLDEDVKKLEMKEESVGIVKDSSKMNEDALTLKEIIDPTKDSPRSDTVRCRDSDPPIREEKNNLGDVNGQQDPAESGSRQVISDGEIGIAVATSKSVDVTPNRSGVPHFSKFSVGISPHENDNLSESTGMLKRIMNIFRKSKEKGHKW